MGFTMKGKKGFTLLELLIAATIVGTLAVLATISYRSSQIETVMAASRAQAEMLAGAVQRFRIEYPLGANISGLMENVSLSGQEVCDPLNSSVQTLVRCGFLENHGWSSPYVGFYVCNGKTGDCASSPVNNPLACMKGLDHSRMPNRYRTSQGYIYCISATGKQEQFGTED